MNNTILGKVFTQRTFKDLLNGRENENYSACMNKYLNNIGSINNIFVVEELYNFLKTRYRNEYYYKNTLLNKLLLGKHSLKTTVALSEIPIEKSKADFILINGKAVVYEIKTELDSFDRLKSQINDYYSAFNHVCVVTCESNYNKLNNLLNDTPVGIYVLTKKDTLSIRKKPIENNTMLSHQAIFKLLRKSEYERIIKKVFGGIPQSNQFDHYKNCYNLFMSIDIHLAYKFVLEELKLRNVKEVEWFKSVPLPLKSLVYFSDYKKKDYVELSAFLDSEYRG
ncbi:sce7726 family protein [Paenibacillus sp. FSL H3-0457]|uniref:sce7726 family protein n=1 Tax=Paenibacillus sp. FSL H3-0457 TaxID=2921430 RepID=UPI0030EC3EAD